ncbi:hypothetical protein BH10CYA1_BH10CYA1_23250 [soil metagenome]
MLRLIQNEKSSDQIDNIVELHPVTELNLVELDNIVGITAHHATAATESCADGVCSINWKPSRPSAA